MFLPLCVDWVGKGLTASDPSQSSWCESSTYFGPSRQQGREAERCTETRRGKCRIKRGVCVFTMIRGGRGWEGGWGRWYHWPGWPASWWHFPSLDPCPIRHMLQAEHTKTHMLSTCVCVCMCLSACEHLSLLQLSTWLTLTFFLFLSILNLSSFLSFCLALIPRRMKRSLSPTHPLFPHYPPSPSPPFSPFSSALPPLSLSLPFSSSLCAALSLNNTWRRRRTRVCLNVCVCVWRTHKHTHTHTHQP